MTPIAERTILRLGGALTGLLLLASAVMAADLAAEHMASLRMICGASAPHCGWCYAAAALALASAIALFASVAPNAGRVHARAD